MVFNRWKDQIHLVHRWIYIMEQTILRLRDLFVHMQQMGAGGVICLECGCADDAMHSRSIAGLWNLARVPAIACLLLTKDTVGSLKSTN